MKIKKFVANSMPEAMKQIKEKLGNDAVILNSKEIKPSGIFGLFRRKKIEVTAMLDDDAVRKPPRKKEPPKTGVEEAGQGEGAPDPESDARDPGRTGIGRRPVFFDDIPF